MHCCYNPVIAEQISRLTQQGLKMTEAAQRGRFGTKIGIVLATAGSAVGLGNIWRFPTQAGENGGSAFILIYLVCIVALGLPLMIAEMVVGRRARACSGKAFVVLAPNTNWKWLGLFTVLIPFLILSYYNVVAGWVLAYVFDALAGNFVALGQQVTPENDPFSDNFTGFITNPYMPVLFLVIFMFMTHYVIVRGVERGIEKFSKVLMPVLFLLMIMLVISALTMPGAKAGLTFLFYPDFSAIDSSVVLSALGQCFYSMSLGMGVIITYASYYRKDASLPKSAFSVAGVDTIVAIMAGIIIFPAVFSVPDLEPNQGPSLVFIALPNVFNSVLSGIPVLAYLVPLLFYLLLTIATITSTMCLHEVVTAFISEHYNISRAKAAFFVSGGTIFLGVLCSLSFGPLAGFTLFGMNLFDLFDYTTAKLMLPIAGLFTCAFVGWRMRLISLWKELTSYGQVKFIGIGLFLIAMRYIAPILIILIMLSELGLLNLIADTVLLR